MSKFSIVYNESSVTIKTRRRHIKFASFKNLYDASEMVLSTMEWRRKVFPDLCVEQENDGLLDLFRYIKYGRKRNALIHLRMVARLLYWHKLSVEKLWDPSKSENHKRILDIFYIC